MVDFTFRCTTDFKAIARHLSKDRGIGERLASKRLHALQAIHNLGEADNVIFDFSGGVYKSRTRERSPSLTTGGGKGESVMKKVDAWVILRLEDDAIPLADYIAVKGVYERETDARSALEKLSPENRQDTRYILTRSRRFLSESPSVAIESERVQGIEIQPPIEGVDRRADLPEFEAIRALAAGIPDRDHQKAILPLLSCLAENWVARTLDASIATDSGSSGDLQTRDGTRIEVKTILLDRTRRKAPNLQFPKDKHLDFFVIVLFNPDITLNTARIIPADALDFHARSDGRLRVTPTLLHYPGSQDIAPSGSPAVSSALNYVMDSCSYITTGSQDSAPDDSLANAG